MDIRLKGPVLFSTTVILTMVLAACSPAATPTAVLRTVVVTGEGKPVVQTQIVVQTALPQASTTTAGPIMAEGLVACNPLPLLPEAAGDFASVYAPEAAYTVPVGSLRALEFTAQPQTGGNVYRIGVFEDITTTNLWSSSFGTGWDAYMLPPRWYLYTESEKYFTYVPSLAKALPEPLTREGDVWTVTIPLRDDVAWSDGTALTAKDVAWTANTALVLDLIGWSTWYDSDYLQGMEAVDDYAVKIIYHTKPGLARHEYGTLRGPIMNAAFWQAKIDEAGVMASIDRLASDASEEVKKAAHAEAQSKLFAIVPDGEPLAGAYVLEKWEKGAFLVLAANPDWADKGLVIEQWASGGYRNSRGIEINVPEGDPDLVQHMDQNAESIVFTIYASQDAALLALQAGEVDFVLNPLGFQRGLANKIRSDPNLTTIENSTNGYRYLSFNTRRRPMNDCAFRQTVAVLIDKEFLTETILQGVASPRYTFIPPANTAWYNDDVPKLGMGLSREQRTDLARQILKQAGYTWEGGLEPAWDADNLQVTPAGRLLMPDGTPVPPLVMHAPSPGYDPLRSTFALWIETWLNEFGIPLKANLAGFNVIVPLIFSTQDFDMFILGWSLRIFPSYLYDFFAAEQAVQEGSNAGGYVNPEVEAKLKQILVCETFEECRTIADELQYILAVEVPYVLLFDTGVIEAYRSASVVFPYDEQLGGLQYSHTRGAIYPSVHKK